jgi:hypothetical protein
VCPQVSGAEATDCPFTPADSEKEFVVLLLEEIEATESAASILGGACHFIDILESCAGIVDSRHVEGNAGFLQATRQPVVAVKIDLQAERCPGGHPNVTQPKRLVDKVEVVVQAFPRGGFQQGMAFTLVIPGAIRSAGFHGREDMDQAGVITPFGKDRLDSVFLAKGVVATNKLDLNA